MAKFNPLGFNYELVHQYPNVDHYQRKLATENCNLSHLLELTYWIKENIWVIYVDRMNLKPLLKGQYISDESHHINLYVGRIISNQDYRFLINKHTKDPFFIYKLSCQ